MNCVIFAGGEIFDQQNIKKAIEKDAFVICADSGYDTAKMLDIKCDLFIGDGDSVSKIPDDVKVLKYPCEKNETDTFIAADYAAQKGFDKVLIIGAFGKRFDHSIANLSVLKMMFDRNIDTYLYDGKNKAYIFKGEKRFETDNKYISFFNIESDTFITLENFKYNLNNKKMSFNTTLCVSNEIINKSATAKTNKMVLCVESN